MNYTITHALETNGFAFYLNPCDSKTPVIKLLLKGDNCIFDLIDFLQNYTHTCDAESCLTDEPYILTMEHGEITLTNKQTGEMTPITGITPKELIQTCIDDMRIRINDYTSVGLDMNDPESTLDQAIRIDLLQEQLDKLEVDMEHFNIP